MSAEPHIFRWDLDKTYLKSEFETLRDLVRTARLTAEERENIPGSAALIRAIKDDPHVDAKVFFISGSPSHLRATLERKLDLDGVVPDGFVLKPTISHMLRGRFRAVRGQVAYKLGQLLQGRAEAPVGTIETLFGDDAENDAFIYSLYADLLAGRVKPEVLHDVLRRSGAYVSQIEEIEAALEAIVREDPIQRIVIHLDQRTPPVTFLPFFPRVVPIYNHLQTAIVLYMDGTLGPRCIRRVSRELLGLYGYDERRLVNLAEDILRRRRQHVSLDFIAHLASDLRAQVGEADEGSPDQALDERVDQVLAAMAHRVEQLRDARVPPPIDDGPRDYRALWEKEMALKAQRKKIRKSAST